MRLAHMAPDAPVLGNIRTDVGATSPADLVSWAIIRGKATRVAITWDNKAEKTPA